MRAQRLFCERCETSKPLAAGFFISGTAPQRAPADGEACTQPCRTEEDHIEIFKGNALALDAGPGKWSNAVLLLQHSEDEIRRSGRARERERERERRQKV